MLHWSGTDQAPVASRKIASYHKIREPKLPDTTSFGAVTNTNRPPLLHCIILFTTMAAANDKLMLRYHYIDIKCSGTCTRKCRNLYGEFCCEWWRTSGHSARVRFTSSYQFIKGNTYLHSIVFTWDSLHLQLTPRSSFSGWWTVKSVLQAPISRSSKFLGLPE